MSSNMAVASSSKGGLTYRKPGEPSKGKSPEDTTPGFSDTASSYFTKAWVDSPSNYFESEREGISPFYPMEGSDAGESVGSEESSGTMSGELTNFGTQLSQCPPEETPRTKYESSCDTSCSHYPKPIEIKRDVESSDSEGEDRVKRKYRVRVLTWGERRIIRIKPVLGPKDPPPTHRVSIFKRGGKKVKRIDMLPMPRWSAVARIHHIWDLIPRPSTRPPLPQYRPNPNHEVGGFITPNHGSVGYRIYLHIAWGEKAKLAAAAAAARAKTEPQPEPEPAESDGDEALREMSISQEAIDKAKEIVRELVKQVEGEEDEDDEDDDEEDEDEEDEDEEEEDE